MSGPRFDGFYHDGMYFEAACDNQTISWPCHYGCSGHLEIPMAQLSRQKLGTITLKCPSCHSIWQLELSSLSRPICGDIMEIGQSSPPDTGFFSQR
ncbi:hypothetical protein M3P05_14445 [Sansalvadorimonas sp. 2012CJ34-2]|uniref:Uncharacterized protein n=1 Tax=Parendozoicomonas callyspongiae TaxID=2942213 RepID=A0ABT0PIC1_9GAMM|nr:hypothetical protein [Sansalvadorimonas sp. 2012CJ34-2]MCL6271122.1 hypothetical protein [Sansalvadorimonas sp. 2012CJ34-2]